MRTVSTRDSRRHNRNYIEGNTARRLDARSRAEKLNAPRKLADKRKHEFVLKKKSVVRHLGFVSVIIAAMVGVFTAYLSFQSEIFGKQREITKLESQLNDLRIENEEEYARIMGSVDLEEIKKVAMDELGMTYPAKSQMISVADNDSDYVRQYGEFPTR